MEVFIAKGYFWKTKGIAGRRIGIETLQAALTAQADCGPCGCDNCYGFTTHINAETGELMMKWITGTGGEGDEFIENIDTYEVGLAAVKVLKAARD
jgi:hypothetical protein